MSFKAAENTLSKDEPRNTFCLPTWLYESSMTEIWVQNSAFCVLVFLFFLRKSVLNHTVTVPILLSVLLYVKNIKTWIPLSPQQSAQKSPSALFGGAQHMVPVQGWPQLRNDAVCMGHSSVGTDMSNQGCSLSLSWYSFLSPEAIEGEAGWSIFFASLSEHSSTFFVTATEQFPI